jgi:hypothetical protein
MRSQIRGALLALALAAALTACAATAPASSIGTGAASSSAPPATASASAKHMHGAFGNYTRVVRDGQTFYCDQEKDTGTRMLHETCLTQSQMEAEQENARNFMQGVQGMAASPPANPNSVR